MQYRWMHWPLRRQLGAAIALIIGALLIGFGVLIYGGIASYLRDQAARQLRAQSSAVIGAVWNNALPAKRDQSSALGPREREQLATLANALSSSTNSAVVYTPDGATLATGESAQPAGPGAPTAPQRDDPAFAQAAGGTAAEIIQINPGERLLTRYEPIRIGGTVVAIAQVATSLAAGDALLRQLAILLVAGTLVASVAALLLVLSTVRTVLQPLNTLLAASQQVAAGNFAVRSGLAGESEIGRLGAAFDHMVAQVQSIFAIQRRFVADAAHELRTPLTAMGGQTELLLMGAASEPERQRHVFQRINGEVERMARLVNDLLTLSRLDSKPSLQRDPLDLAALARDTIEATDSLLAHHTLALDLAKPIWVRGDADRLRQVLVNLLDNARKYTPEGGTIGVTVAQEPQRAVLNVCDSGTGIPPNDLANVWDRFFRVDQARTRATGGAGLGLAIVKGIVEAHGGSVAMKSAVGQGTTVTVALPKEAAPE